MKKEGKGSASQSVHRNMLTRSHQTGLAASSQGISTDGRTDGAFSLFFPFCVFFTAYLFYRLLFCVFFTVYLFYQFKGHYPLFPFLHVFYCISFLPASSLFLCLFRILMDRPERTQMDSN